MWNYKFILTTMKKIKKDKWDHWHQKKQHQEYLNIHSVKRVGLQFTLIKQISMAALSASLASPSFGWHCQYISLFTSIPLPSSSLLICSPPPLHPYPFPCPRWFLVPPPSHGSSSSSDYLSIPFLSYPPHFQHGKSSPWPCSFLSSHSRKCHFYPFSI